ncbi:MAG: NFACT family protein, partial [Clostridia bacterium]|nr:NFACT family protein [Clostridia bacterium]
MAFDAGMVAAVAYELRSKLIGGRIDKIGQPEKDEIVLMIRIADGSYARLAISAGNNNPHINLTSVQKENPMVAPMFCMLLRKHLSSARVLEVIQPGFERVIELLLEARDEMGFLVKRRLIAEIMGKYSNIIFTDENYKIINAIKPVDFSTTQKRQVLPGMRYELPPAQEKRNPLEETADGFYALFAEASPEQKAEKWIVASYLGISPLVAREMVFSVCGRS